jgi:putative ABC transport system permease protein
MLTNYFKIAWRNARRNKVSTLVNVVGLTLGLTGCLLITAYVLDDLSYDRFHQNADRIVLFQQFEGKPGSGGKFATDLKSRFAQVTNTARLTRIKPLISRQQTAGYESQFWFTDSSVFSVFTLPLVQGNPRTALTEQYGVVLSETMARKYFAGANPMGQSLRINNKATLHVTGVLRDLPANSHLTLDFLANYANANELVGYDVTTNYWGGGDTWTYLLLAPGTSRASLQAQLPAYIKQLGDPNAGVWKPDLIPLTDIYLRTNLIATNRLTYAYIFAIVALLILGLACFNYVNLATARATQRAKEVGVRKVMGSSFGQLWRQFLSETVLFMTVAVALSVGVATVVLPAFNELADKQLTVGALVTGSRWGWLLAGLGVVSLLAGSYPAFVLSSFRPIAVLKGSNSAATGKAWLRKTLVVGQFAVSVTMIVATVIVYNQLQFIRNKNVGYQREQVLTLDLRDAPNNAKELFKKQVAALPGVEAATRAFGLPGSGNLQGQKLVSDYVPKGSQTGGIMRLTADGDFLKTFGIKLLQGRNLDPNRPADKTAFLVNRAAMKLFGWTDITGKMTGYYTYAYNPDGSYREVPQRGQVIGVIDDYNHADLKTTVAPMLVSLNDGWEGQLGVRIRAGAVSGTIQQLNELWRQQFPDKPLSYEFLDDVFNRTYRTEARTGQVFGLFAALAVHISCLGLFGLATFTAEQRTKEIGVRKVLGASVASVVTLLSKDFLKPVLIAIVIASPIAWYAMNRWLQDFAYRIDIEWWVFALAGLLAIGIALLTVSFQSVKAALMNPVKSLRSE